MRYLLIPIKNLANAKQRLSTALGPAERCRLATRMMERTLQIATKVTLADRIAVVTSYPPAMDRARAAGLEIIAETEQFSESDSVDFASREVMQRGASAVLRIPTDLPLITSEDIDSILATDSGRTEVILVPSRDGTGTNAIFRRPPDIFPSLFGQDSLQRHRAAALAAGIPCRIVENPNVAFEVDHPEDLEACRRAGIL